MKTSACLLLATGFFLALAVASIIPAVHAATLYTNDFSSDMSGWTSAVVPSGATRDTLALSSGWLKHDFEAYTKTVYTLSPAITISGNAWIEFRVQFYWHTHSNYASSSVTNLKWGFYRSDGQYVDIATLAQGGATDFYGTVNQDIKDQVNTARSAGVGYVRIYVASWDSWSYDWGQYHRLDWITVTGTNTVQITIASSPSGRQVTVDGNTYTAPVTFSWGVGSAHTLSTPSPQSGGSGIQYVWTSWGDGGAQSHQITVPATILIDDFDIISGWSTNSISLSASGGIATGTITAGDPYMWKDIQDFSGSTYGYVIIRMKVNSPGTSSAQIFWVNDQGSWSETRSQHFSVVNDGAFYVYTIDLKSNSNWNGRTIQWFRLDPSDQGSSGTFSVDYIYATSAPTTYTANYNTQYYLTVNSAYDSPTGAGWYNSGSSASFSVSSPVSAGTGIQYVCTGYSGDASGSGTSGSITMNGPKTITFNWKTQYQHTVTSSPATGSGFIKVDGVSQSTPYTTPWWDSGSSHTLEALSPVSGGSGIQYVWTSWSDGGAQSHSVSPTSRTTFTANYKTQYYLTMQVSPSGGGSVSPSSGWRDSDSSVSISATPSSGYIFSSWTGSGSGSYSGTDNPKTITMNAPITETANFQVATVSITITSSPTGSGFVLVDGTPITTPQTYAWTIGSTHTIAANSPANEAGGSRYVWVSWSDGGAQSHTITIPSTPTTYTANFCAQYQLTMQVNPSGGGTTTPAVGSYWYDSGSSVPVTATPASGYAFDYWVLDGNNVGSSNPYSVTMNGAHSLEAKFKVATVTITFQLGGVGSDASGTILTIDGVGYSYSAFPKSFTWSVGSTHSVAASTPISAGSGKQYVFTSWTNGDGLSGVSGTYTTPSSSQTVTANYKTQYQLLVSVNNLSMGSTIPSPGRYWYDSGVSVQVNATENPGYVFSHWNLDGANASSSKSITVTMSGAHTLVAHFSSSAVVVIVTSDPKDLDVKVKVDGETIATPHTFNWPQASTHRLEAPSSISNVSDIQYVFMYWTCDSTQSTQNPWDITVSGNSQTYTAHYGTQYYLTVDTDPAGLSPTLSHQSRWYDESAPPVTLTADRTISKFGYIFNFKHWKVDGIERAEEENQITVSMNSPHTAVACYSQSVSSSGQIAFPMCDPLAVYGLAVAGSALCLLYAEIGKRRRR